MVRRTVWIAVEVAAGIAAFVLLLGGIALWRLSSSPVDLDFLKPDVEAALSVPDRGLFVQVGRLQLTWEADERDLDLRALNLWVRDAEGVTLARLPRLDLRLSLRAAMSGRIAMTQVEVIAARLRLQRDESGRFAIAEIGVGDPADSETGGLDTILPTVLAELIAERDPSRPLSFLNAVRILDAAIHIEDRRLGVVWNAPVADIALRRTAGGLGGDAVFELDLGKDRSTVYAELRYAAAEKILSLETSFTGLSAEIIDIVAQAAGLDINLTSPLEGRVGLETGPGGELRGVVFDLAGGTGHLAAAQLFPDPLEIDGLALKGAYLAADSRLEISEARLQLPAATGDGSEQAAGPTIRLKGHLSGAGPGLLGDLAAELEAEVDHVALSALAGYWPEVVVPDARAWVTGNIPQGTARDLKLAATLEFPAGDVGNARVTALSGSFGYDALEVHYLRPLPPITSISGAASFTADSLEFRPEGGLSGELVVEASKIVISDLQRDLPRIAIETQIEGSVPDALALLDHPRLGLITPLGIDPAASRGRADVEARFDFPLMADLEFESVEFEATAALRQTAVRQLLFGKDAELGELSLQVDPAGMTVGGTAQLGGVPVEFSWREAFSREATEGRHLKAWAPRVTDDDRAAFGLEMFNPYVKGPVELRVDYRQGPQEAARVAVDLGLRATRMQIEELSWNKPAGLAGRATFVLGLVDDRLTTLEDLEVEAGSLKARGGRGRFEGQETYLGALDLATLQFAASVLSEVRYRRSGSDERIEIGGGRLDAGPFLETDEAQDQTAEKETPAEAGSFRLRAPDLAEIALGERGFLVGASLEMHRDQRGWHRFALRGELAEELLLAPGEEAAPQPAGEGARVFNLDFGPGETDGYALKVWTPNMGGVLRALDILETVRGGQLQVTGTSPGPMPQGPLTGNIMARDYVMVDAPRLAQLLTLASLTGVVDSLNGEGIRFDRLVGDFTLSEGLFETELVRAYGSAIGITAQGSLDFNQSQARIAGTVVPAYSINRVLGKIPFLGKLLTGGEGEGLVAFTYRMTGPFDEMDISINPLSALAPGFLRGLLRGSGDPAEDGESPPPMVFPEPMDR